MSDPRSSGPESPQARQNSTTPILEHGQQNVFSDGKSPNGSQESSKTGHGSGRSDGEVYGRVRSPSPAESPSSSRPKATSELNGSSSVPNDERDGCDTDYDSENGDYHGQSSDDWNAMREVMSNMFGQSRQAASEEEKTRHVGVVWKNLTVRGVGLGASIQPTISDIFLAIPRGLWGLLRHGPRRKKKALRTIIDDFTGCVRPGEMMLVLGQPGSGCSTLLKVLGNQRAGYESIDGEVTYGGTDAERMAKNFRSEVLYNPEDDLHYASLTVRETLNFALKTRTPGKESRKKGESRSQYRKTFLDSVAKLFWIEHCLDTRVGGAIVRGVSGGEKKRVSIAEALITKASTQCWDNSTRGLDASTALEYVQSLRSLTNMANVSTLVAIYQASESLYNLFDKVILLTEGKCAYFGPATEAKQYFEDLGFECPPRWTSADFITSVTEPHARRPKPGWEDRIPRSAEDFQQAYMRSEAHQHAQASVKEFERETAAQAEEREAARTMSKKKNFTIPYHLQVLALTQRQFLVMVGDKQSLFGKWSVVLFLALIVGSLFYNLPSNA